MAVIAPRLPTMKYWKSLPVSSPAELLYLPKLGILVVFSLLPTPLKGLSKDEVAETSETLRFCTATQAGARTAGN
jgi:hypothetical protein